MPGHITNFLTLAGESAGELFLAALWSMVFVAWGRTLLRFCGQKPQSVADHVASFWLGVAVVTLFGEVWHLLLPINALAASLVVMIGIVLLFTNCLPVSRCHFSITPLFIIFYTLIALWAADRSTSAPLLSDSGEYHFPVLRWLHEYPVIPGLGNLDPLLATNQLYFIYAALLNAFPIHGWSFHYASLILVLAGLVLPVRALAIGLKETSASSPLVVTFHLLTLAPYSILIRSMYMSCPTPDLAIDVLEIVLCGFYLEFLSVERARRLFYLLVFAVLIPLGLTLKLSFVPFSLPLGAAILVRLIRDRGPWPRLPALAVWSILVGAAVAIWLLTGVIETGYPIFPLKFGGLPLDWKIPDPLLRYYANTIHSEHGNHMPSSTWPDFAHWLRFNSHNNDFSLKFPSFMAAFSGLTAVGCLLLRKLKEETFRIADLLAGILAGIVVWFVTSPLDRFAVALFWLISILLTASLFPGGNQGRARSIIVLLYFAAFFQLLGIRPRPLTGQAPEWPNHVPKPLLFQYQTRSGLVVNVPVPSSSANPTYVWDSPLPAARHPDFDLELRGSSIQDGFRIRQDRDPNERLPEAYADLQDQITALGSAVTHNDLPRLQQSDVHIHQLCQAFLNNLFEAVPRKSPELTDRLTEMVYASSQIVVAARDEDFAGMQARFRQMSSLVAALPSYYPPSTLSDAPGR